MKEIILKPEDIKEYNENDPDTYGELIKKASKEYILFRQIMTTNLLKNFYKECKRLREEYERGETNNKES